MNAHQEEWNEASNQDPGESTWDLHHSTALHWPLSINKTKLFPPFLWNVAASEKKTPGGAQNNVSRQFLCGWYEDNTYPLGNGKGYRLWKLHKPAKFSVPLRTASASFFSMAGPGSNAFTLLFSFQDALSFFFPAQLLLDPSQHLQLPSESFIFNLFRKCSFPFVWTQSSCRQESSLCDTE